MKSEMTIDEDGNKEWKLPNGEPHREDGAFPGGHKVWYLDNAQHTKEEFKRRMRDIKLKQLL
jgi:hypothetical protein